MYAYVQRSHFHIHKMTDIIKLDIIELFKEKCIR